MVFAPPLPGVVGESVRYDDVILIVLVILILAFRRNLVFERLQQLSAIRNFLIVMYLLILVILFSWLLNEVYYTGIANNLSTKEILRVAKYVLVMIVGVGLGYREQKLVQNSLLWAGLATVCIQLFQYLSRTQFNEWLIRTYGAAIFYDSAISEYQREIGAFSAGATFANKNVAAAFLLIPYAISLGLLLTGERGRSTVSPSPIQWTRQTNILVSLLLGLGLVLAGSRAGLVAWVIVLVGQLVLRRLKSRTLFRTFGFLGLLALLFVYTVRVTGITTWTPTRIMQGITDSEGSLNVKAQLLAANFENMTVGSALFGYGASTQLVDFEYGHFLVWYGFLGIVIAVLLWMTFLVSLWRDRDQYHDWITPFSIVLGYLAMNLSQTTFLSIRTFPLFLMAFLTYVNWQHCALPAPKSRIRRGYRTWSLEADHSDA